MNKDASLCVAQRLSSRDDLVVDDLDLLDAEPGGDCFAITLSRIHLATNGALLLGSWCVHLHPSLAELSCVKAIYSLVFGLRLLYNWGTKHSSKKIE
jgi:hypothetical protein